MAERTLLANARILTCSGDADEKPFNGDVLIEGNRIARVAPGRIDIDPAAVRVVDLAGATVLPGLGDAHVHTSWPLDFVFDHGGIAATPPAKHMLDVAAVTGPSWRAATRSSSARATTQPLDDILAKDAIERGLIPGPRIVPSGPMIAEVDGLGADGELMEVAADAAQLSGDRRPPVRPGSPRAQAVHLRRRRRARVPLAGRLHERRDADGRGGGGRQARRVPHHPRPRLGQRGDGRPHRGAHHPPRLLP